MKKIMSLVLTAALSLSVVLPTATVSAASTYNYAEALQKSFFFYEAQQAGPLPDWNRVEWRGDSTMGDDVKGGWYDAGDHVKFNLPMAYSAAMIGWSMYEYPEGYEKSGQMQAAKNNLKFVLDYLVACDKGSSVVYQVGDGGKDHTWWGPVEVIEKKMTRPSYTGTGSCVVGEMAAALAIGSIVLNDSTYLTHAKSLFSLADSTRSDSSYTAASGYYNSWSGFYDELLWASTWLYVATKDESYLSKAEAYVPKLNRQGQTTNIEFKWSHCWDDVHYGAMVMLAKLTGKQEYKDFVQMHLDWWTVGYNGEKIKYTPGGLAWNDTWGCLRYATTAGFLASVYADYTDDSTLKTRYESFAKTQMDYCLGSNPSNRSYVCGFGTNPPVHPHHRTAQGSWADNMNTPPYHRHILYGALVGGPSSGDAYADTVQDYTANEVATDYNAGYTALLAKMCSVNGGTPLANFPQPEKKEDEFFVEAGVNSAGPNYTEIKAQMTNQSGWPARTIKDLSFNYYMDLTEVLAAGAKASDLTVKAGTAEFPVTCSEIKQYSGNIYYVKVKFEDGTNIYPGGQSPFQGEVQFRISAPTSTSYWDAKNDYSYDGLGTSSVVKTKKITVYDGSTLIFGIEPDGTTVTEGPTPTKTIAPPTPTPTNSSTVLKGDMDLNGSVNSIDLGTMRKYLLGLMPEITPIQLKAGDYDGDGKITSIDLGYLRKFLLGML
ncbi:glycoside hydrolase family 9 protein [Acetivibrio cellulolyticus]|uniref:glycoside hydrolase family 9 protein n=1 Tax=Acetivibrio cellulolyticus TaxID=35830 RepID=UPI0001E2C2EC|nr:glycoside hydrolase family 9 protein [Acetivibrio cellulolyticus]